MEALLWLLDNFGLFFGGLFLGYIFLVIRRLVQLYDILRDLRAGSSESGRALGFLDPLFARLRQATARRAASIDPVVDAIWAEVDGQVAVHFTALQGYVNTLVLVGFAGTICGAIGAFNEMFNGLAEGQAATEVFVASWNNGLATALYTSLGAAAIGALVITLVGSRWLMVRAKRLETLVGLRIADIIEEASDVASSPQPAVGQ